MEEEILKSDIVQKQDPSITYYGYCPGVYYRTMLVYSLYKEANNLGIKAPSSFGETIQKADYFFYIGEGKNKLSFYAYCKQDLKDEKAREKEIFRQLQIETDLKIRLSFYETLRCSIKNQIKSKELVDLINCIRKKREEPN